jgi:riboflavin synthase alpha subunit
MTNLKSLKAGDPVNLEVDLVAKYIEKMIRGESGNSALTVERLGSEGF